MDDYVTLAVLASSAFFAALSIGLLFRYRQVSQRITASSDLGKDLWQALEQRMKKQDERILDMMGRFEVVQARSIAVTAASTQISPMPLQPIPQAVAPEEKQSAAAVLQRVAPRPKSQPTLDDTQVAAINLLSERARNTIEIKEALGRSREHTARLMKSLFDHGLVIRDDSKKPFVYQLTDAGRRYLSAS